MDDVQLFPLTTLEDSDREAALKYANALREFGDSDHVLSLAESLESAARGESDRHISDLFSEAAEELHVLTPQGVGFGYREEIEGYAFWSAKENHAAHKQWVEENQGVLEEMVESVSRAQRERHREN
jgi:hypothetical protein